MLKHIILMIVMLMSGVCYIARPVYASAGWQSAIGQKGVAIESQSSTDFASATFNASVKNAQAMHVNYITLIIPYYQSDTNATAISATVDTPTDASLVSAITYIHSLGIHVMLSLHDNTNTWRGFINPPDKNTWFSSYGAIVNHYAQLGQAHKVEELCIATEMVALTEPSANDLSNWTVLIRNARSYFSGYLTYSANWGPNGFVDEKDVVPFWSQLDYIGISAYMNLTNHQDASVGELENAWNQWIGSVEALHKKYDKPILFTETGYQSLAGANEAPWNYTPYGRVDMWEQTNDFQALFSFWSQYPWMVGFQIWRWNSNPDAGGLNDPDYTPQHKPAQDTIATWFKTS